MLRTRLRRAVNLDSGIVCIDCGGLPINVADLVHALGNTPIEWARCTIRGTLADLGGPAIRSGEIFEFQSRENSK